LGDLTDIAVLKDGQVEQGTIDPAALGLTAAPLSALKGGGVEENSAILQAVLQGKGTPAQRDVVAVNAALALQVGEKVPTIEAGLTMAQEILVAGSAWHKLEELVAFLGN